LNKITQAVLGEIIDLIGTIGLGDRENRSKDGQGERPGKVAHHGEADTSQIRLPPRQAGEGYPEGTGTG
jgi:hypothetical protein